MLVRWNAHDPWRELRAVQRQMDRVFADLMPGAGRRAHAAAYGGPAFNIHDVGDKYVLEAELPGIKTEDLSIDATANSLTIKGKRQIDVPEGYAAHRRERSDLEFSRAFTFESKLDLEKTTATLKHGMLRIELGKEELEKPRTITVKAG